MYVDDTCRMWALLQTGLRRKGAPRPAHLWSKLCSSSLGDLQGFLRPKNVGNAGRGTCLPFLHRYLRWFNLPKKECHSRPNGFSLSPCEDECGGDLDSVPSNTGPLDTTSRLSCDDRSLEPTNGTSPSICLGSSRPRNTKQTTNRTTSCDFGGNVLILIWGFHLV